MVHKDKCPPSPESTGCYLMLISFGVDWEQVIRRKVENQGRVASSPPEAVMTTPIINHLSTRVSSFAHPPHAQTQDPRLPVGNDAAKITTAGDQQTLVRRAKEMGISSNDRGRAGWALIPS